MLSYDSLDAAAYWFKIAYSFVPFMPCAYYQAYVTSLKKGKLALYVLYLAAIAELLFLWLTDYIKIGAYTLFHVGLVWEKMPVFSYFLLFGMSKYLSVSFLVGRKFYKQAKIEQEQFLKAQFRNFAIFFFIISGGTIEWAVALNIPLHIGWLVVPPIVGFFAYSVIRYRFMEIDTVIHKTFLWAASIFSTIIPAGIFSVIAYEKARLYLPRWSEILLFSLFLIFFTAYYNRIRPYIDKLFRRKKYAYLEMLGTIAKNTSGIIDLEELSQKTLAGIKETLYPQNICLLLKDKKRGKFYLKSSYIGKEYKAFTKQSGEFSINIDSGLIDFFTEEDRPVEKNLLKFDPAYRQIINEAKNFFGYTNTIIIFGLIFQKELIGLLAIGKKENLQEYTRLDIDALQNLSLNAAGTFYTAFHHYDIIEGQRLIQEVALAKHIQENLLPQQAPKTTGISLSSLYMPSREIGGDYYDFLAQDEISADNAKQIYITIGDVSGKGIDAGLVVSFLKSSLGALILYNSSCKEILSILNRQLFKYLNQQKFISLLFLKYLSGSNKLVYSSAGHEHIIIKRSSGGDTEIIKSGGLILGMLEDISPHLEENTLELNPKDKILLYTDGATEARNKKGNAYGLDSLSASFKKHSHLQIGKTLENVYQDIQEFVSGEEQHDDITLVGIQKD